MRRTTPLKKMDLAHPGGGGEREVNGEGGGEEGEKKEKVKLHHRRIPLLKQKTPKKRKVSPQKPSARKKTHASKPQLEATLTEDDISLVRGAMEDASEDILQRYGVKQEELYGRVEKELKEIQQAIQFVRAVPTAPSSSETAELGDEPTQLRRLADATEARLQKVQEEKEKATEALKKEKEEVLEKLRVARYCVTTYENEKDEFQAMLEEKAKDTERKGPVAHRETAVKEVVRKALHSVPGLAQEEHEAVEVQVMKLAEAIQQLQARITELEIQAVPSTPQEVHDQREEAAKNTVGRIRALTSECKQLSDRSAQTYERLTEDPELRKLEAQLQEAQQQALTVQAQMKSLTAVERMKRSQEQRTVQQQITAIQGRVMEVTQKLQPVQDEACKVFEEIEGQGSQLDQVVATVEQCLEGPVTEKMIQELH
jgi:chromosome segregation ATPase